MGRGMALVGRGQRQCPGKWCKSTAGARAAHGLPRRTTPRTGLRQARARRSQNCGAGRNGSGALRQAPAIGANAVELSRIRVNP